MDGKGRCMDNIFVERPCGAASNTRRSTSTPMRRSRGQDCIGAWLSFTMRSQHQSWVTARPRQIYQKAYGYVDDRLCDRLRFPRFWSKLERGGILALRPHTQGTEPIKDLMLMK